ncbi:MAG: hypothetical protein ABSG43_26105, partial [Solirubrobacteraceae bacterium]
AVLLFISGPLRRVAAAAPDGDRRSAELEAARAAKYREIRDAELDHGTGKLSDEDFDAIDRTLRAQAVEILHQLDGVSERSTNGAGATITGR